MYKHSDIDNLIDKLRIEDVVGEFVELKKSGANYKGLCPFHQDSNPSFIVSPAKNICKCFVCGAGGNPVTFYSKYKKVSFNEAVKDLSKKYNMPIYQTSRKDNEDKKFEKYYKIMDDALEYYTKKIFDVEGRSALEYLSNREITPKLVKEHQIGYATSKWDDLYTTLANKSYETEDLVALGLIKKGNDEKYRDTFRNRVIFPIFSSQGRIIAFGGRTLETDNKEVPKYINSSDTPIFKKGKNLYGIEKGALLRKRNYAILMEGYMDVLSASVYGIDLALAPLGTALTEEQAILLKRYTSNVILAFDSDEAGRIATERAILILKAKGFNIRILKIEGAKDPDEFLKKYGKVKFLENIKNSLEAFDYLYDFYIKDYDITDVLGKQHFIERFKDFFASINNNLEKELYLQKLSQQFEIKEETLKNILVDDNKPTFKNSFNKPTEIEISDDKKDEKYTLELISLKLILNDLSLYDFFSNITYEYGFTNKIFSFLEKKIKENPNFSSNNNIVKDLKNYFDEENDEQGKEFLIDCSAGFKDEYEFKSTAIQTIKSLFRLKLKDRKLKSISTEITIKKMVSNVLNAKKLEDLIKEYNKFEIETK